jgi:predicted negative regulator of RcsB-dependent stress response
VDTDPYSLTNLRDIVVPDAPPFWPPAPGAWVALGVILALVFLVAWRIRTQRKRNAYRKAGLVLLVKSKTAHEISVTLKRVALAAFPRASVASLYGDQWAAFLHRTCPREHFQALAEIDAQAPADAERIELASTWIRHHCVPDSQASQRAN